MAASLNWEVLSVGVLVMRALHLEVHIRAPDSWELSHGEFEIPRCLQPLRGAQAYGAIAARHARGA